MDFLNKKVLFLDFDGVLHPNNPLQSEKFKKMDILVKSIKGFEDNVLIVISSSWRMGRSLCDLKILFPSNIAKLVIATTPVLGFGDPPGLRLKEIMKFCDIHHIKNSDWLAIDDIHSFFTGIIDSNNLLLTNGKEGLKESDIIVIQKFLRA